jgi:hypothetical protein
VNLEHEEIFTKLTNQPSRRFLQFAEGFLSNGKSDKSHDSTVSFRNCMLRVPGSINSKNDQTVRVKMQWNGYRPAINYLLSDFCVNLAQQKAAELREQQQWRPWINSTQIGRGNYKLQWIEILLQTPINDHRKFVVWRIIAPYLLNVKKLSPEQTRDTIKSWLDRCNEERTLDFNVEQKIKEGIKGAEKGMDWVQNSKTTI